jgi:predicted tellurium resistance membrane protein TerC
MLLLLFLGLASFSIYRSKERPKTMVYTVAAMILTIGIVLGAAQFFPALNSAASGEAAFDMMLLIGALTALVHSRISKA